MVRVNTSVARLPRRHEMVPLLLLAAAAALALAVSAAETLTGSAGEIALIRARHGVSLIVTLFFVDISEIGDVYYINKGVDSIQSISVRQYEVSKR